MISTKKPPLMNCEIRHSLPGRVRIYCRGLGYLEEFASVIKQELEDGVAVNSVSLSTISRTILIYFNASEASSDEILDRVTSVLGSWSLSAFKQERAERNAKLLQERRLEEESVGTLAQRIGVTSITLLFAWLRPGPAPQTFLGRFLSMPALTAMGLAWPIVQNGTRSLIVQKRPNADTLSSSAILASVAAGQGVSALTIILLADIAELLTAYTMDRTRNAIREMLSLGEEFVWRIDESGHEQKVPLSDLRQGDHVISRTGEKISVDGLVLSGEAAVDQSSITGEYLPVRKITKDEVFAGTVVKSGRLVVEAERVGDRTAIARIINLVEEAAHKKATIQSNADRFSAQLIPINFALAVLVYFITGKFSRALNMLIIDYSCGVRLSTATALSASICTAARNGVLVKGSNYLEALSEADTVVFDKTGTLTEGRPVVSSVICSTRDVVEKDLLCMAAAAEETSNHPMAGAIVERVRRAGWPVPQHSNNEIITARGVTTKIGRSIIRVGSRKFMQESKVNMAAVEEDAQRIARQGENVIYVARGRTLVGIIGVQDVLREDMKKALNRLRNLGMDDIILLTGDVEQHAEIVAARMAMDRYHAEVMPDEKAENVLRIQSKGTSVVMVGDGINDAPALAYSDVGIAMGSTRTDIAMEAADITITGDDPLMIPSVLQLSQKTMNIVRQNFGTAIGVNTLGIMLASVGVLPVFWGAVLHNSCTVAVVLNSSRLLIHDMEKGS
ncbi:MAG: cation-translocating P-type ATPase [Desulfofustis sp.]|nr:cation-translocating P-type ATPase [Desulfofustis sp.]